MNKIKKRNTIEKVNKIELLIWKDQYIWGKFTKSDKEKREDSNY